MKIIVLGSAAGGGLPQWNCRCAVCSLAWEGDARVLPRTQSSVALSNDGTNWLLTNASPDLRQQILATPALHPVRGPRDSPVKAVILTNGDVDHCAGLLNLRESQPFKLYATAATHALLAENAIFDVLNQNVVERLDLPLEQSLHPLEGLKMTAFPLPGKVPLYAETSDMAIGEETDSVVGFEFRANGRKAVFMPNCAAITPSVRARMKGADFLLFDGTTFTDDEMPAAGLSSKTARRMGHVPMDGPDGSLAGLADIDVGQKVYTHINNTNPALVEGSEQRRRVEAAGWILAEDGMEFVL